MTPGQAALDEAARLESARVYGSIQHEHQSITDEAALAAALLRQRRANEQSTDDREIEAALHARIPVHLIVDRLGVTYSDVRAARKRLMRGAA